MAKDADWQDFDVSLREARRFLGVNDEANVPDVDRTLEKMWYVGFRNSWSMAYEAAKELRIPRPSINRS